SGQPRAVVVETEQLDDGLHIFVASNAHADPSRVRQDVVMLRASRGHELLPDRDWKWKIGEAASMQMAELSSSYTELDTAETMRSGDHAVPRSHFAADLRRKRICHRGAQAIIACARRWRSRRSGLRGGALRSQLGTQACLGVGNDLHCSRPRFVAVECHADRP